jgi:hypothetical protein
MVSTVCSDGVCFLDRGTPRLLQHGVFVRVVVFCEGLHRPSSGALSRNEHSRVARCFVSAHRGIVLPKTVGDGM